MWLQSRHDCSTVAIPDLALLALLNLMNLTRYTNRFLARLLVGVVVFAQGMMAADVYAIPSASVRTAAVVMPAQETMSAMPCHEDKVKAPSVGGCLTHCSQADQVNADHQVPFAAPIGTASWNVAAPAAERVSRAVIRLREVADTGPPLPIRFCSFLN